MWCILDNSSDVVASVPLEWATILQDHTNALVSEHTLPIQCYSNLHLQSSYSPAIPMDPIAMSPLSHKLVLDIDKDPLYTLCHPSVTTALLNRIR